MFFIYPCSFSRNAEPEESLVLGTHTWANSKLEASVPLASWLLCARCETHAVSYIFISKYVFGSDISHPHFRFYSLSRVFVLAGLSLPEQRQDTLCVLRSVAMRHRINVRCSRECKAFVLFSAPTSLTRAFALTYCRGSFCWLD